MRQNDNKDSSQHSAEWLTHESDQLPETGRDPMLDLIKRHLYFVADNDHLEACLAKHTPKGFKPPTRIDWERARKPETSYHAPFADYLNQCREGVATALSSSNDDHVERCAMDTLFTDNFLWSPINKTATSRSSTKTRPALMGCILENPARQLSELMEVDNEHAEKFATNTSTVSWEHVISFVEVKNSWPLLVPQAASYARQILAYQPHRVSVRCIMLNQSTKDAVIAEIDRAGGYATRMHRLSDEHGIRRFSLLLAGMYCCSTDAHGYNRRIQLQSDGREGTSLRVWTKGFWFYVRRILCNRNYLWGRGTRAFLLQKAPVSLGRSDSTDEIFDASQDVDEDDYLEKDVTAKKRGPVDQGQNEEGKSVRKKARSNRIIVSVRPNLPWDNPPPELNTTVENEEVITPIVLVDYWSHVLHRRDDNRTVLTELEALRRQGLLVRGIVSYGQRQEARVTFFAQGSAESSMDPEYYYADEYKNLIEDTRLPSQHAGDTADLVSEILKGKDLEDQDAPRYKPEAAKSLSDHLRDSEKSPLSATRLLTPYPRYETLQECLEVGQSLMRAKDGIEVLASILGAMYGYRNLFHLGYLHRDISPGNIIIVDPEARRNDNVVDIEEKTTGDGLSLNTDYTLKKTSESTRGMLIDMSLAIKRNRANSASEGNPGLTGTRIFVAMHLLEDVAAQPSAVYDMESFLWTFLYVLLHQNRENLVDADAEMLSQLSPNKMRDYKGDAGAKALLLLRLSDGEAADFSGVLEPYLHFMPRMANLALNLWRQTIRRAFRGFDSLAELQAIQEYISTFESLLEALRQKQSG